MKEYELTVLIHPDLDANLQPMTDKIKDLIEDNGGKIVKENNEGKKKLAYEINKQDFAVYYYYELELPAMAPAKISSSLNIMEGVMRYLLVAKDERKTKMNAKQAEKGAKEVKEEE